MSNPVAAGRLSFEENLNILLEELDLARQWDRPSILLAVHKSKFGQQRAQAALEERLRKLGQDVVRITVDQEQSDVPHRIINMPDAAHSVFFVSNLDWGGGLDHKDAYRALNIQRELLVDNHLRLVLWLTVNEAASLARFAPDFWSFRHRVIEFTGQRIPPQVKLPAGVLIWDVQNSVDPFDALEARIAVREELLSKLPPTTEARSSRVDLLYNLGYLYWIAGDAETAKEHLNRGLELIPVHQAAESRSLLLNGLAIICYENQDYANAADLLRQALELHPDDASLLINLSFTSNAIGRNQEAATLAKRADRLRPRDPRIWSSQGYLYAAMGKLDDSIASFAKAVELAPQNAAQHAALGICYALVERTEDTARELDLARDLARDQMPTKMDIYEAALAGSPAAALDVIRTAVESQKLSIVEVRRDPNLSLLMDPAQLPTLPTSGTA